MHSTYFSIWNKFGSRLKIHAYWIQQAAFRPRFTSCFEKDKSQQANDLYLLFEKEEKVRFGFFKNNTCIFTQKKRPHSPQKRSIMRSTDLIYSYEPPSLLDTITKRLFFQLMLDSHPQHRCGIPNPETDPSNEKDPNPATPSFHLKVGPFTSEK